MRQPKGFLGVVPGFPSAGAAAGGAVLRLPKALHGESLPVGPFGAIEVRAFTESMGVFERFVVELAERLDPGGRLVLDVDSEASARQLRVVLEGRPGSMEPVGSFLDPTRPLSHKRVLAALEAAKLHVEDVVAVPAYVGTVHEDFTSCMFGQGFLPVAWLDGAPPTRFWITATKNESLAGTVVIGLGEPSQRQRTLQCVRAFLPEEWEVLLADGATEAEGFSRAIAAAKGDLVWFLRAGSTATAEVFGDLCLQSALGVSAPAVAGIRTCPGDLSGTMAPRTLLLGVGPLPERQNSQIALEEYCMRLETMSAPCGLVDGVFCSPPPPVEAPRAFAEEASDMMRRWRPVLEADVRPGDLATRTPAEVPWLGRSPRITLCMIARDEQRFLAECLTRASKCVDEIVVVDTGSKDDTVSIAESFGAKVLHRPWDDDFAAPRNLGLDHATGDWILVLDADEFLGEGAAERIRELSHDPAAAGFLFRFVNICPGATSMGVMMVRLFRNLPGIRWQHVIHEQITPTLVAKGAELGLALAPSDVEVEHHGYSDEVMSSRNKNERNERLFEKQLSLEPDDIYCHYKYGDFLRRVPGREADSERLLDRCLELIRAGAPSLPRDIPYAGEVAALCALSRARKGRSEEALAVVDEALRRFVPTPNLHYVAATLLLAAKRPDAAIANYRRCLAYRGQTLVVPVEAGVTGHVALVGIAQALAQKGDVTRSLRLARRAAEMAPDYEVGHLVLSKLQLTTGDTGAALRTLTNYLTNNPDSPGACQQTTLILQRLGHTDQARKMGRRAVDLLQARGATEEVARMNRVLAAI